MGKVVMGTAVMGTVVMAPPNEAGVLTPSTLGRS
jgi:hypothetical protein